MNFFVLKDIRRWLCSFTYLLCGMFMNGSLAEPLKIEFLYTDGLPSHLAERTELSATHVLNGEFDAALSNSQALLDVQVATSSVGAGLDAQLRINHGIFLLAADQPEAARISIQQGLDAITPHVDGLDPVLKNAYMALGLVDYLSQDWEAAESSFLIAQNIVHRNEGVMSVGQQDMLYFLTMIALNLGHLEQADRLQLFSLMVDEHTYGDNSRELIPVLSRLGSYFAARGNMLRAVGLGELRPMHSFLGPKMCRLSSVDPRQRIWTECYPGLDKWQEGQMKSSREASEIMTERENLFDTSLEMYERAVAIHRQNQGYTEYNLMETLTAMAQAYVQKGKRRKALQLMREAAVVDESYPSADLDTRIRLLVELGDLLLLQSESQAYDLYLRASRLYGERHPEHVNTPFTAPVRLKPGAFQALADGGLTGESGSDYFAVLHYDVNSKGRVENIRVLQANVPGTQLRHLKIELKHARFRPRIEQGELARAEDRRIRITYQEPTS